MAISRGNLPGKSSLWKKGELSMGNRDCRDEKTVHREKEFGKVETVSRGGSGIDGGRRGRAPGWNDREAYPLWANLVKTS
jgi:hypothetical protein